MVSSAAPESARWPRWITCQSVIQPSTAEYWHMGAMTMRLASSNSPTRNGVNSALMSHLWDRLREMKGGAVITPPALCAERESRPTGPGSAQPQARRIGEPDGRPRYRDLARQSATCTGYSTINRSRRRPGPTGIRGQAPDLGRGRRRLAEHDAAPRLLIEFHFF